ncbi:mast cell protease 2-like [Cimex lectularius]|uniref:Peptidase S1 domain-containing protein n=1 Tax=Cimex lectularius TaxID=79782 RepID=A0A8I6SUL6_CIMLE|nr:mast cell protease 2-like [Cimex lectularius]
MLLYFNSMLYSMYWRGNLRRQLNCKSLMELSLFILFISDYYCPASGIIKIIGGRKAKRGEFPATVCYDGFSRCGGTLVTLEAVISAAHCFIRHKGHLHPNDIIIIGGVVNLNERSGEEQLSYVRDFIIHEKFERRQIIFDVYTLYDIALAFLESPFVVTETVKPALFPAKDAEGMKHFLDKVRAKGASCFATGYGVWAKKGRKKILSDNLKVAELRLLPDDECALETEMIGKEVCATSIGLSHRTAPGDSGSTFYCDGFVIGMAKGRSSFLTKGKNISTLIFTLIGPYIDYFDLEVNEGSPSFQFYQVIFLCLLVCWHVSINGALLPVN